MIHTVGVQELRRDLRVGDDLGGYGHRFDVPDIAAVPADCAIGGEKTRTHSVQDRHFAPPFPVGPGRPDGPVVAVDVGPVVGQDHVFVRVEQGGDDQVGGFAVSAGEGT